MALFCDDVTAGLLSELEPQFKAQNASINYQPPMQTVADLGVLLERLKTFETSANGWLNSRQQAT
jgi:hypothetical protein